MTDEATDTDQFGRRYDGEVKTVAVDLVTPELEAVARAIAEALDVYHVDDQWRDCVRMARAALLAIREPTDGMIKSAGHAPNSNAAGYCASEHRAMIDHVLVETAE